MYVYRESYVHSTIINQHYQNIYRRFDVLSVPVTSLCSFSMLSVKLLGRVGVLHLFKYSGKVIITVDLLNPDHNENSFHWSEKWN